MNKNKFDFVFNFLFAIFPYALIPQILKEMGVNIPFIKAITLFLFTYLIYLARKSIKAKDYIVWPYVFMILVCFPIGLYYMWKYGKWGNKIKIIVTILIIAPLILWVILT